jgi:hypothetical protein
MKNAVSGNQSHPNNNQRKYIMANCCDMKEGDLYICNTCGLELAVKKACACSSGSEDACSVPLMCCGKEMTKQSI